MRHRRDVRAVFQALAQDHVHHAQRERGVGARADGDVPVGQAAVRVR
jgi:hypothetical protein